jgi:hypothetical protein
MNEDLKYLKLNCGVKVGQLWVKGGTKVDQRWINP